MKNWVGLAGTDDIMYHARMLFYDSVNLHLEYICKHSSWRFIRNGAILQLENDLTLRQQWNSLCIPLGPSGRSMVQRSQIPTFLQTHEPFRVSNVPIVVRFAVI